MRRWKFLMKKRWWRKRKKSHRYIFDERNFFDVIDSGEKNVLWTFFASRCFFSFFMSDFSWLKKPLSRKRSFTHICGRSVLSPFGAKHSQRMASKVPFEPKLVTIFVAHALSWVETHKEEPKQSKESSFSFPPSNSVNGFAFSNGKKWLEEEKREQMRICLTEVRWSSRDFPPR